MNFLRKAAVAGMTSLLVLLLFAIAFDFGIMHSVGNASSVKKVLSDSGVYNTVLPNALNQAQKISTSSGDIPLTDPQVQTAAKAALTPTQIQTYANQAIDSIYAWLNGKTAQPNFQIDLSGVKAGFANNLADVVQQRATSLPTCSDAASAANFDAYNATCLPPGVTPANAAVAVRNQVLSGKGFLDKTTISAQDLKGSGNNQSVFDGQLKQLPKQYQKVKRAPLLLSLIAVLTAAGIVFLSSSRRRGVGRVGMALAVIGIFMLLFAWGLNRVTTHTLVRKISISSAATQKEARTVVTDLEQAIDKNYWLFGIAYTTLGSAILASDWLLLSKLNHNSNHKPPKPPVESVV